MGLRAKRLRYLQPLRVGVGNTNVAVAGISEPEDDTESDGTCACDKHRSSLMRRHDAADEADRMRRGADRIQQQRRQAVFDVIGHRQQAVLRHRQVLRIAARPVPADQAGDLEAHLGIAATAGGAAIAMKGYVDRATPAIHPMSWLFDDAENFVAGSEFSAFVPQLEIRAAQRRARYVDQNFTRVYIWNFGALDRNAFVAVKYGCLHRRVGPVDCCHFDALPLAFHSAERQPGH